MNSVEIIREMCKTRGISIAKLERDCGFSNGYIRGLREGKLPSERAAIVADYFEVPLWYIVPSLKDLLGSSSSAQERSDEDLIINAYRNADSLTRDMVKRCLGISGIEDTNETVDKIVRKVSRKKDSNIPAAK